MRGIPYFNFPEFEASATLLHEAGFEVFSPHNNDFQHGEAPDPEGENALPLHVYMQRDLPQVCASDCVFFLPGWQDSRGAILEWNVAQYLDVDCWDLKSGGMMEVMGRDPKDGGIIVALVDPLDPGDPVESSISIEEAIEQEAQRVLARWEAMEEKFAPPVDPSDHIPDWQTGEGTIPDEDSKPTNPKDLIGSSKLPIHLWPTTATELGCLGLLEGALKYGRTNWRAAGIRYTIYHDAINRHLNAAFEGEWDDPDSGLPHWAHVLACAAIVVDAYATGNLVDDRAYRGKHHRGWIRELTPHVERMKDKYSDRNPKHWTKGDER